MPPYRRRYGRKSSWKKRRFSGGIRKSGGGMRDRSACLKGRKPEKKFVDLAVSAFDPGTGGTLKLVSDIAQGVTQSTRVGRRATILSMHFQGQILPPASVSGVDALWNRMKVFVVQDLQANAAAFGVGDLLATADIDAYRNLNNLGRFKILAQRQYVSNAKCVSGDGVAANTDLVRAVIPFKLNVKCCIPIDYDSTAGAITEQNLNSVHLMAISESAAPAVTLAYNSRIRYTD